MSRSEKLEKPGLDVRPWAFFFFLLVFDFQ